MSMFELENTGSGEPLSGIAAEQIKEIYDRVNKTRLVSRQDVLSVESLLPNNTAYMTNANMYTDVATNVNVDMFLAATNDVLRNVDIRSIRKSDPSRKLRDLIEISSELHYLISNTKLYNVISDKVLALKNASYNKYYNGDKLFSLLDVDILTVLTHYPENIRSVITDSDILQRFNIHLDNLYSADKAETLVPQHVPLPLLWVLFDEDLADNISSLRYAGYTPPIQKITYGMLLDAFADNTLQNNLKIIKDTTLKYIEFIRTDGYYQDSKNSLSQTNNYIRDLKDIIVNDTVSKDILRATTLLLH